MKDRILFFCLAGTLLCFSLFLSFWANAQQTRSITLSRGDTIINFEILIQESRIKTDPGLFYTWYKSDSINTNQGGFSGYLLHGLFNRYIRHSILIEQGTFKKGLKNGEWKYWDNKGKLIRLTTFSEGLRQGQSFEMVHDTLIRSCYKKDVIRGLQFHEFGDSVQVVYYKTGKPTARLPWWAGMVVWFKK